MLHELKLKSKNMEIINKTKDTLKILQRDYFELLHESTIRNFIGQI